MRFLDEKGRIGGKVHFFDLLVIAVLLIGIGGMGFRLVQRKTMKKEYKSAEFIIEIQGVRELVWDAYKEGDTLYEKGIPLGTVKKVEVLPYITMEMMDDGSSGLVEHVLSKNVKLTVTTDRLIEKKGYYIETLEFLNGTRHDISNGLIVCEGIVRELRAEGSGNGTV